MLLLSWYQWVPKYTWVNEPNLPPFTFIEHHLSLLVLEILEQLSSFFLNTIYSFNIPQFFYNRIFENYVLPHSSSPLAFCLVLFWHQMDTEQVTGIFFTVKPASLSSVLCSILSPLWVKSQIYLCWTLHSIFQDWNLSWYYLFIQFAFVLLKFLTVLCEFC